MINGHTLRDLCKVLSVFQDEVRMNHPVVVDKDHVMLCIVEPTPMFQVECEYGLNVKSVLKMKPENEAFEASVENDRFVLSNKDKQYSFHLLEADGLPAPKAPVLRPGSVIETRTITLLNAVEKCMRVNDWCEISKGRMTARSVDTEVSMGLGEDDGENRVSRYPLDYLAKICKVMIGKVRLEFDTDAPLKMEWADGAYRYTVMIAPRVEASE